MPLNVRVWQIVKAVDDATWRTRQADHHRKMLEIVQPARRGGLVSRHSAAQCEWSIREGVRI